MKHLFHELMGVLVTSTCYTQLEYLKKKEYPERKKIKKRLIFKPKPK